MLIIFLFIISNITNANILLDTKIDSYKIKAIKVERNTWYKIIVWVSEPGENLESMVKRYGWVSWVNWAYFCPAWYKECEWANKTWADRISNGYNWSATPDDTGPERVVFALNKYQVPFLFRKAHDYSKGSNTDFIIGKTLNFHMKGDIYNWIGNFPLLLQDWVDKLSESNLIDAKMKSKNLKNFICSSKDGNIIYMWWIENVTIYQVPGLLLKLGCYNAINLDSGWSTAMIYNNKYIRWPWRDIMDALIVIPDKNYPIKSIITEDPKILKIVEQIKNIIEIKFLKYDDFTRKQKLYGLSSKLEKILKTSPESKKPLYQAIKKMVDSYIQ